MPSTQTGSRLRLLAGAATLAQAADDYSLVPDEFIYCTTCHGVELRGNVSVDAPRLNGMEGWYLKNQMLAFKKGPARDPSGRSDRHGDAAPGSRPFGRTDRGRGRLCHRPAGAHQTPSSTPSTVMPARGETLYASCGACHGTAGEGNKSDERPGAGRPERLVSGSTAG